MPEPPPVTTAILPEKSFIGFPPLCPPPPIRLAGRSFSYTAQHLDRHVPPSRPANSYRTETFASIQSEIVPFRYTPSKRSIFWMPEGEVTFRAPIFRDARSPGARSRRHWDMLAFLLPPRCQAHPLDDRVKGRREDQPERRDTQHAAEHGRAERLPHFRPGARRDDERRDAQDESKRRHQNGAQPRSRRVDRRLRGRTPFGLVLTSEFHDQNRVLRGEANQNHETDLRQNVDRHAAEQQAADRGEQTHRHDQYDRERHPPTLIFRGEDEEHEQCRGAEDEDCWRALLFLLERDLGPFETDARRKHLRCQLLHPMQR